MGWLISIVLALIALLLARKAHREAGETAERVRTLERLVQGLTARLHKLEQGAVPAQVVAPPAKVEEKPPMPVPTPVVERVVAEKPYVPPPPRVQAPAAPSAVRETWEATLGGNWLNKLGVLVLVLGIAFGLTYSFSRMAPAGRVALGLGISLAMLGTGVFFERRENYRIFSYGLIAGGWAGVYFATYASYAVDAAKVVGNPVTAVVLLSAVAAAMIAHSLRYQSEWVTGLACLLGFLTLAVTPVSGFALVASLILAAALLFLSHRFGWSTIALLGAPATYGLFLWHASRSHAGNLAAAQALLVVYWLVFEAFDLLDARLRRGSRGAGLSIAPLNALGFVSMSAVSWFAKRPEVAYQMFALAAGLYLVDTVVRAFLFKTGGTKAALRETYEFSLGLASALAACAIGFHFKGPRMTLGFAIEAQLLFLAGVWRRQRFPRALAALLFAVSGGKLLLLDSSVPLAGGGPWREWSLVALFHSVLFYMNRGLNRASKAYGHLGAAAVLAAIAAEAPAQWVGVYYLLAAMLLYEFGHWARSRDFRNQSYWVGAAASVWIVAFNLEALFRTGRPEWAPQIAAAALFWLASARIYLAGRERVADAERSASLSLVTWMGSATLAVYAWNVLPPVLVAPAWAALALVTLECALTFRIAPMRAQAQVLAALGFARLWFGNYDADRTTLGLSHRLLTAVPVALAHYYLRIRLLAEKSLAAEGWELQLARLHLYAGSIVIALLARFELGRGAAVMGWAAFALVLVFLGLSRKNADLRFQSYLLAAAAFVRCWTTNFNEPGQVGAADSRWLAGAVVIASLYAAQFAARWYRAELSRARNFWGVLDGGSRDYFSVLASVLLTVLLYFEISGARLTVAWGVEGAALLAAGFPLRERILRLSGLALLLVCIGKLFLYDLRNLDTPSRILSFIVLGVLLIAVSWIYTRFRGQISKLLSE